VSIAEPDEEARAMVQPEFFNLLKRMGLCVLMESPETIRKQLAELENVGVQEVILSFPDTLQLDSLRFFAREIIANA
jgi:hypothetical protein